MFKIEEKSDEILEYLMKDKYVNSTTIGAFEETEFYVLRRNKEIVAVLSKIDIYLNFNSSVILTKDEIKSACDLLSEFSRKKIIYGDIVGEEESIKQITQSNLLKIIKEDKGERIAYLEKINYEAFDSKINVEVLKEEDIEEFFKVHGVVFGSDYKYDKKRSNYIKLSMREKDIYVIKERGKIVACGNSTVINKFSTIVGISTLKEARNKGYASSITAKLCEQILNKKAIPVLFYDNPKAASIYMKLGFKEIPGNKSLSIVRFESKI